MMTQIVVYSRGDVYTQNVQKVPIKKKKKTICKMMGGKKYKEKKITEK